MPKVNGMYTCIRWNIGTTWGTEHWEIQPAATKYLLKTSHISLLLEVVTGSWEISVGRLRRDSLRGTWLFSRTSVDYQSNQIKMRRGKMVQLFILQRGTYFRSHKKQQCQFLFNPGLYSRQCPYCITYLELTVFSHPSVSTELTHILQKDIVQFHRGQTSSSTHTPTVPCIVFAVLPARAHKTVTRV